MAELFTDEILDVIALELDMTLEQFKHEYNIDDTWTDQMIYNVLPDSILPLLDELGLNASWFDRAVDPE